MPSSPPLEDPRAVLRRHELRPKRSWGQNFLTNLPLVERMAAAVAEGGAEQVIEVGAGAGTLTVALARAGFQRVVAIERDRDLAKLLRAELGDCEQIEVEEADAARFDFVAAADGRPTALAGNLPYQLTGRLLRRIIEARGSLERSVVMVQREVAERMTAAPGSRSYGVLSVMCQAWLEPKVLFRLSPGSFHPPPKVASAVVALHPSASPRAGDVTEPELSRLVHAAFGARRKTLRNTLGSAFDAPLVSAALAAEQIDPGVRAERLAVEQLAALAARLCVE